MAPKDKSRGKSRGKSKDALEDVTDSTDTSKAELSEEELEAINGGAGFSSPIATRAFNPQPEPPTKEFAGSTLKRR